MRDFRLVDTENEGWDIDNSGGSLHIVEGVDCLIQRLRIKCQHIVGEWYLDTASGAVNFVLLGNKNPDIDLVSSLIRETIEKDEEVVKVLTFTADFNQAQRKLSVSFTALSVYGEIGVVA